MYVQTYIGRVVREKNIRMYEYAWERVHKKYM
jgi:hypothetical protein